MLKESDLEGHLLQRGQEKLTEERGAPPTNEELHLGVARIIPTNPQDGADVALRVAFDLVRGRLKPPTATADK
jgi:hypothetical protein